VEWPPALCAVHAKACPTHAIDFGNEERKKFRILIVDDEMVVRDSLKEWLEDEGFQTVTAESGPQAIERLTRTVFTSCSGHQDAGMDGVKCSDDRKEMRPDLPVVMMTAYARWRPPWKHEDRGMDYLMKPFNPDTLVPLVVQLFQKIEGAGEESSGGCRSVRRRL